MCFPPARDARIIQCMGEPRRIMFVITDLQLGGTPGMLRDLAVGLQKAGRGDQFDVSVVSLKPLRPREENVAGALQAGGVAVWNLRVESPLHALRGLAALVSLIRHQRPHVVVSMLVHANLLTTAALPFVGGAPRPKFVQSMQTLQEKPGWHWRVEGMISSYADAIAAPAQPILDRMAKFGDVPPGGGMAIPNGIDVDRFAYAKPFLPGELPWPNGSRVVGYLGRFDRVKNLPLLMFSFAELIKNDAKSSQNHAESSQNRAESGQNRAESGENRAEIMQNRAKKGWELALVGYGEQENALKKLSTRLHLAPHVHFMGPTTVPERWYKSFTVHCLPSSVEGFGLTLAESIAAGTPVVALRTAVTEKIVRDGIDGILLDRADPKLLAQALQAVARERETARLGSILPPSDPLSGVATMKRKFSVERMVTRWGNFLKNL